ncbi:Mor transcription activator family protein [Anabaena sp. PCC 7108]|uniref:Mor transcription activator family protein n=1 Tax=Anabaena sp. PCC 7108 TaxID=163908 RepID=UPI000346E419|nr:Mor transcription activator family protein [Anabaena sp. PCC 7108]
MENSDISEVLPKTLKDLNKLIGLDATLSLVEKFGGSALYIPKSIKEGHKLSYLAYEHIELLVREFAGTFIYIPLCRAMEKSVRNQKIAEKRQSGTIDALAKEFNLSRRYIWYLLKKEKDNNASEVNDQSVT